MSSTTPNNNNNSSSNNNNNKTDAWILGRTRVVDTAGFIGTIVYKGTVASAKDDTAIYAGIVWDNADRGKHDGTVVDRRTGQLVRHFSIPPPLSTTTSKSTTTALFTTPASFVPAAKVHTGVPLTLPLVLQKYVATDSDERVAPDGVLPHTMRTAKGRGKPVYFLGELQIRSRQQVHDLTAVSLRHMAISSFDCRDWSSSHSHCPTSTLPSSTSTSTSCSSSSSTSTSSNNGDTEGIPVQWREIDLAGNLLSDWSTVAALLHTFGATASLSLAQNRLGNMQTASLASASWLSAPNTVLQTLNLHGTRITATATLLAIGRSAVHLQELCVAQCALHDLNGGHDDNDNADDGQQQQQALADAFGHLQLLDCSRCGLESHQVRAWALLPRLQRLSVDDNPVESVAVVVGGNNDNVNSEKETLQRYFPSLQHLQVAGSQICSWLDLEQLNALPSVTSLRLRKCPLLEPLGTGEARCLLIARLPALQHLNSSPVTDSERTEAEKRYVLQVHRQVQAAIATTNPVRAAVAVNSGDSSLSSPPPSQQEQTRIEILALHPQWERLAEKHQEAMSHSLGLANKSNSSLSGGLHLQSLADTVLNVTICSMAASSCTMDPLIRRLPSGLQVGRLKALCARHFGLDIDLQTLHFRTCTDAFPLAMDDDENTLAYYGVSDGAEILMNEQDVQQREKDAEQEVVNRMRQQELELNSFQERQKRQGPTTIASAAKATSTSNS